MNFNGTKEETKMKNKELRSNLFKSKRSEFYGFDDLWDNGEILQYYSNRYELYVDNANVTGGMTTRIFEPKKNENELPYKDEMINILQNMVARGFGYGISACPVHCRDALSSYQLLPKNS